MLTPELSVIKQHLIDPEICIRCNTCEATCPVGAITHDDRNYVVDVDKCELCMACIAPCPTGSIDNWRTLPRINAYGLHEQLGWDMLPAEVDAAPPGDDAEMATTMAPVSAAAAPAVAAARGNARFSSADYSATQAPWSAAQAHTQLYGPQAHDKSISATVTGNARVTAVGREYDTHHIVLDFGTVTMPLLEGQSIGILPPGVDAKGRPHHPRQYSIASPRNGERPGYNNTSLTVKRVLEDHQGRPVRGVASNYLCDLNVGERAADLAPLLADPNAYFYVCGLKAMEVGVVLALRDVAHDSGLVWTEVAAALKAQGRLHLETY